MSRRLSFRVHGGTHAGLVREQNEDCFLSDPEIGLFAVFDGMGGHNAGDVASKLARRVVHEYVLQHRGKMSPRQLLDSALQAASSKIFSDALAQRQMRGMGTTAVVCYRVDQTAVAVAHVGDSRAYLWRDGQLRLLTRDHTVVSELVLKGALRPEDAHHHPYKSVLSRNLGGKPEAQVDHVDVPLAPGDRVLLCSDGLTGFAPPEAVEQVLGGAEDPERASVDLIDLALRGGGGDNVTALVLEAGAARVAPSTLILRTTGATQWWARRELFLAEARQRGVARSPICAALPEAEALAVVADNLCQALFHDLEHSTGINVWTFTENLVGGWLAQGGDYKAVRDLLDSLRACAEVVVADIYTSGESLALHLEVAIMRALIVAEMAVARAIAEQTRRIEADLVKRTTVVTEAHPITEERTIPFHDGLPPEAPSPAVVDCLERSLVAAKGDLANGSPRRQSLDCLGRAHQAAVEFAGDADLVAVARELYGSRLLVETGVAPLLESLDEARACHIRALIGLSLDDGIRAVALRRVVVAHQGLATAVGRVIADACQPITEALRASAERTASLRAEVGRGEAHIAELERKLTMSKRRSIRGMDTDDEGEQS